jgi:hypothetical protein
MTSPSVLTEKMPKGSLAFCSSDGRTVVDRSRDLLADLLLGASLLAVVVIVYSFHMAPDLIPRSAKLPFVGGTALALLVSILWILRAWMRREQLVLESNTLSYHRAQFGVLRLRQRIETSSIETLGVVYLGTRGSMQYAEPVWGLHIQFQGAELTIFNDTMSEVQLEWIAQRLRQALD